VLLVSEMFYILSMLFLKITLAIFFLRIMVSTWQRRIVYAAVGLSTTFNLGYLFFVIFQCGIPAGPSMFFIRRVTGQCTTSAQILGVSYAHAGITTTTDLIFGILPIPMLKHTTMNQREKITVSFILILAAV
jgi:hypothetical protein